MIFDWYRLLNQTEFLATGLYSRTLSLNLEGQGFKDVLVTKGMAIGIKYEDVFLSVNLNERNPFVFESHAVYLDENGDIWLGVANED
jgi:hypothetical protein